MVATGPTRRTVLGLFAGLAAGASIAAPARGGPVAPVGSGGGAGFAPLPLVDRPAQPIVRADYPVPRARYAAVAVPASMLWVSPASPRWYDEKALRAAPDLAGWLADLDRYDPGRAGLVGRVTSQVARGEPVEVVARSGSWVKVSPVWQPSSTTPEGTSVGWLPASHLGRPWVGPAVNLTPVPTRVTTAPLLAVAQSFLGVGYLWGGTTPYGLDCSGLVWLAALRKGIVVHRDAQEQFDDAPAQVPLSQARAGDLVFYGGRTSLHHVGIVAGGGVMLDAPGGERVRWDRVDSRPDLFGWVARYPMLG